jgi:hypothetical protein
VEFQGADEAEIRRALDGLIQAGAVQTWPARPYGTNVELVASHRAVRRLATKLTELGVR